MTDIIDKLLSKVKGPLHEDLCWERTGCYEDKDGYTFVYPPNSGTPIRAHRLAWEIHNAEPVPKDMLILHSCDNPCCVNPSHLRVGSHQDNMNDIHERNRWGCGYKPHEFDYDEICDYKEAHGLTIKQTAEYFGCGTATVDRAVRHRKDQQQAG